ncbi:MAG: Maf family protein [Patescibacteria group bacterium]
MQKEFILASSSPRRQELLSAIGLKFKVCPSVNFSEKNTENLAAHDLVLRNAIGKAEEIAEKFPDAIVLGVDTVGALDDHILEKPKDYDDAFRMLQILQGNTHEVLSGLCLITNKKKSTYIESTKITFLPLTDDEIHSYLKHNEWTDKAAAYAAQGLASIFIKGFDGDYFNVVGLPIYRLNLMLKDFDTSLLDIVQ